MNHKLLTSVAYSESDKITGLMQYILVSYDSRSIIGIHYHGVKGKQTL